MNARRAGRIKVVLIMCAACMVLLSACDAGTSDDGGSDDSTAAVDDSSVENPDFGTDPDSGVEVPDLSQEDGADAASMVDEASLSPSLEEASGDDPGDGSGCEVTDQDPVAGELAEEGDEVTISVDCSQVHWESQEGSAWTAFSDAYTSGFDSGCEALFSNSPDGSLFENDVEYTVNDCQNLNPGDASDGSDVPSEVPDDPESAGTELGELDGCQALFEESAVFSLNYGTESITEADCPLS